MPGFCSCTEGWGSLLRYFMEMLSTTTPNRCVHAFVDDLVRRRSDRLQAGRAEAIDGGCRDRDRQTRDHRGNARDIGALGPMWLRAAEDHVADLGRIEPRRLAKHIADAVGRQIFRASHVERAA
jgi:hypothetical protein